MVKNEQKAIDAVLELHNRPLTPRQAAHLSSLSGKPVATLSGLSIAQIQEKFKFELDPSILLFRRISGKVVKKDPASGEECPVPLATVYVEDTDCSLLAYSPPEERWLWFYPLACKREKVASTITDQNGHFCVLIPRWEIDWILRWRKTKICFSDIFVRPSILDILRELVHTSEFQRLTPCSAPDPDPLSLIDQGAEIFERLSQLVDPSFAEKITHIQRAAEQGASIQTLRSLLDLPAFDNTLPPPLSANKKIHETANTADYDTLCGTEKNAQGVQGIDIKVLEPLPLDSFMGPFQRSKQIDMPEWHTIADVPDITFRVTQDINGEEKVIYDQGLFDVRWDSTDIPDVVLQVSEVAVSSNTCPGPDVSCQETATVPAGRVPSFNPDPVPHHDSLKGDKRRPNRPHHGALNAPALLASAPDQLLAMTPFAGTLQLYGFNQHPGACYYRLRYQYQQSAVSTFSDHSWEVFRWVGSPAQLEIQTVTPDGDGWYEILPESENWLPGYLLLNWPTKDYQDGLYQVSLELGNESKHVTHSTNAIGLRVDNALPVASISTLAWRLKGSTNWKALSFTCPVIRRPLGNTVEIAVGLHISAAHLRSVHLRADGCGAKSPVLISAIPNNWEVYADGTAMRHRHTGVGDNSFENSANPAVFEISGASAGVYNFYLAAYSQAFNPAGGDGGFEVDWHYNPRENWRHSNISIAVIDEA